MASDPANLCCLPARWSQLLFSMITILGSGINTIISLVDTTVVIYSWPKAFFDISLIDLIFTLFLLVGGICGAVGVALAGERTGRNFSIVYILINCIVFIAKIVIGVLSTVVLLADNVENNGSLNVIMVVVEWIIVGVSLIVVGFGAVSGVLYLRDFSQMVKLEYPPFCCYLN